MMSTTIQQARETLAQQFKDGQLSMEEFQAAMAELNSAESPKATAKADKASDGASLTKKQWLSSVKPLKIDIGGNKFLADARQFSSGSVGYYAGGKIQCESADGERVDRYQVTVSVTLIGSKDMADN